MGGPAPFQADGAAVVLKLGFAEDEAKTLVFLPAERSGTDLSVVELPLADGVKLKGIDIPSESPLAAILGFSCRQPDILRGAPGGRQLAPGSTTGRSSRTTPWPTVTPEGAATPLAFRCHKGDPIVEVVETFSLGMEAELVWTLNPEGRFTHVLHGDRLRERVPARVAAAGAGHPSAASRCRASASTTSPTTTAGSPSTTASACLASLASTVPSGGSRWRTCRGLPAPPPSGAPRWSMGNGVSCFSPGRWRRPMPRSAAWSFIGSNAEFNALRLDEHLDLSGGCGCSTRDAGTSQGLFSGDFLAAARRRFDRFPCLRQALDTPDAWMRQCGEIHLATAAALLEPTAAQHRKLHGLLLQRFAKWVRQFQGHRAGGHDYQKSVIGFSRLLRGMLIAYELLRKDGALSDAQVRELNSYFVFAARRILDEGRWPHSRTWLHPEHPESHPRFLRLWRRACPGPSGLDQLPAQLPVRPPLRPRPPLGGLQRPSRRPPLAPLRLGGHRPAARRLLRPQRRLGRVHQLRPLHLLLLRHHLQGGQRALGRRLLQRPARPPFRRLALPLLRPA